MSWHSLVQWRQSLFRFILSSIRRYQHLVFWDELTLECRKLKHSHQSPIRTQLKVRHHRQKELRCPSRRVEFTRAKKTRKKLWSDRDPSRVCRKLLRHRLSSKKNLTGESQTWRCQASRTRKQLPATLCQWTEDLQSSKHQLTIHNAAQCRTCLVLIKWTECLWTTRPSNVQLCPTIFDIQPAVADITFVRCLNFKTQSLHTPLVLAAAITRSPLDSFRTSPFHHPRTLTILCHSRTHNNSSEWRHRQFTRCIVSTHHHHRSLERNPIHIKWLLTSCVQITRRVRSHPLRRLSFTIAYKCIRRLSFNLFFPQICISHKIDTTRDELYWSKLIYWWCRRHHRWLEPSNQSWTYQMLFERLWWMIRLLMDNKIFSYVNQYIVVIRETFDDGDSWATREASRVINNLSIELLRRTNNFKLAKEVESRVLVEMRMKEVTKRLDDSRILVVETANA